MEAVARTDHVVDTADWIKVADGRVEAWTKEVDAIGQRLSDAEPMASGLRRDLVYYQARLSQGVESLTGLLKILRDKKDEDICRRIRAEILSVDRDTSFEGRSFDAPGKRRSRL